jgi:lipase chaperone LimK
MRGWAAGAVLLIAIVGLGRSRERRAAPTSDVTRPPHAASEVAFAPSAAQVDEKPRPVPPRETPAAVTFEEVRSLRGTEVDGDLETNAAGRFVPTAAAVRLFEYFLSAEGEAPSSTLRARVAAEAARRLYAPEAARAVALFDRFVASREAAGLRHGGETRDPATALAATHAARVAAFGEEDAAAMFGAEEAAAAAAIAEAAPPGAGSPSEARAAAEAKLPAAIQELHARRAARAAAVAALVAQGP